MVGPRPGPHLSGAPASDRSDSAGRRRSRFWLAGPAVGWVLVVVSAYYAVHKPGTPQQFDAIGRAPGALTNAFAGARIEAMLGTAAAIGGWLATLCAATVLGRPWVSRLRGVDGRTRLALQVGAGLGSLSLLVLGMGAVGAYSQPIAWGIAAISVPLGLPYLLRSGWRHSLVQPVRHSDRWLAGFVIAMLTLAGLTALAPPTAWDSLVYHLTGPRLYLEAGGLTHNLDLPYLGFPAAGSMLYVWGMLLAGDRVPQLIHLTFGLLTLALLPALVRRVAPARSWLAASILIAVPSAQVLLGAAYVDWMVAYAGLASLVLLTSGQGPGLGPVHPPNLGRATGRESGELSRLVLAGFMAGLALTSKYTAVWMVGGIAIVAYLRRRSIRDLGLFAGSIAVILIPYLLKNGLLTGNPVYPFLFPGKYWDADRAAWYSRPGTGLGVGQLAIAPWDATIWGLEGAYFEGHPSYGASVGPLLLALIPLTMVQPKATRADPGGVMVGLIVVCGVAYLGWLAQLAFSQLLVQTRLLFPILPELAILAAVGFDGLGKLGRRGRSARFVVGGLVGLALFLTGLQVLLGFATVSPVGVLTGSDSPEDYLAARVGMHAFAMQALDELPEGSRVRFLWEPRSYYCPAGITCEPDALLDRWWHARRLGGGAEDLPAAWRAEGVTHVLYYRLGAEAVQRAGFDPLTAADWAQLDQFLTTELELIDSIGDAYALYRLSP